MVLIQSHGDHPLLWHKKRKDYYRMLLLQQLIFSVLRNHSVIVNKFVHLETAAEKVKFRKKRRISVQSLQT